MSLEDEIKELKKRIEVLKAVPPILNYPGYFPQPFQPHYYQVTYYGPYWPQSFLWGNTNCGSQSTMDGSYGLGAMNGGSYALGYQA